MQQQNDDKPPDLKLEKAKGGASGGRTGQTVVGTGGGDDPSASQPPDDGESVFDLAIFVVEEVFLKKHCGANWQQAWPEAEACAMDRVNTKYGGGVSIDLVAAAIDQVISSYTVQEFTECGVDELCIMYPFIERTHLTRICKLVRVYGKHKPSSKS
jgi:hypothetical protein